MNCNKTVIPILLNDHFKIVSYNGGSQADLESYSVKNVLTGPNGSPHCSNRGNQFDLVLESDVDVTLTHFAIVGPTHCTAPIKSGYVNWFF